MAVLILPVVTLVPAISVKGVWVRQCRLSWRRSKEWRIALEKKEIGKAVNGQEVHLKLIPPGLFLLSSTGSRQLLSNKSSLRHRI